MGSLLAWVAALTVFLGAPTWYALRRRSGRGRGGPSENPDASSMASWRFQGSGGSR